MAASQDFASQLPLSQELAPWVHQAWDIGPVDGVEMVNLSENAMYRVDGRDGTRYALRISQPGYQSDDAIRSECWLINLLSSGEFVLPQVVGELQFFGQWRCVLFQWIDGEKVQRHDMMPSDFEFLGRFSRFMQARLASVDRPNWFTRPTWSASTFLTPEYAWGDWRDHPAVTLETRAELEQVELEVLTSLADQPCDILCHGDLRAANLLRLADGSLAILDFDDSAYAWNGFDLAAALSFDEHLDTVPARIAAWSQGSQQPLGPIEASLALRRLSLIGWMTTHPDAPEARELGAEYVVQSAGLLARL